MNILENVNDTAVHITALVSGGAAIVTGVLAHMNEILNSFRRTKSVDQKQLDAMKKAVTLASVNDEPDRDSEEWGIYQENVKLYIQLLDRRLSLRAPLEFKVRLNCVIIGSIFASTLISLLYHADFTRSTIVQMPSANWADVLLFAGLLFFCNIVASSLCMLITRYVRRSEIWFILCGFGMMCGVAFITTVAMYPDLVVGPAFQGYAESSEANSSEAGALGLRSVSEEPKPLVGVSEVYPEMAQATVSPVAAAVVSNAIVSSDNLSVSDSVDTSRLNEHRDTDGQLRKGEIPTEKTNVYVRMISKTLNPREGDVVVFYDPENQMDTRLYKNRPNLFGVFAERSDEEISVIRDQRDLMNDQVNIKEQESYRVSANEKTRSGYVWLEVSKYTEDGSNSDKLWMPWGSVAFTTFRVELNADH